MPDRDGATCPTCLTLNPPAAPSCVRCNTPLSGPVATLPLGTAPAATGPGPPALRPGTGRVPPPDLGPGTGPVVQPGGDAPDPTLGSKRIGPGLGAAPRGAPGSSRAHAAAVQPPGHGVDEAEPAPAAPDPDPALARRVTVAGLVLVALVLAVGGGVLWLTRSDHLDSRDVESAVGAELSERGGGAVAVSCPGDPRHRSGDTFSCVATDTAGGRRTLTVTVLDDAGRYRWTLDP